MHKFAEYLILIYAMSDDKFLINLRVDGRVFPLRVRRSAEGAFRKAAKNIDDKLNRYKIAFGDNPELSTTDFLIMAAIHTLGESYSELDKNDTEPYKKAIGSLVEELNIYLKK